MSPRGVEQYSARRGACGHSGAVCASRESGEFRRNDCQKSSGLSSAESRHDLEVRSWILRMQRLSACAQGAKRSDSKASMSAFGWLHQEGGAWQCGAVSRRAPAAASMCKEGARARAGRVYSWPPRACRASLGIARRYCVSCRARRGQRERGKLFVRVVCCCAVLQSSADFSIRACAVVVHGRTKFDFASDSCSYKKSRVSVLRD